MELAMINSFFNCKKFAVAGVSLNNKKTGNSIYRELKKQMFDIVPLNPNIDSIEGEKCYHYIHDLPNDIDALIVATKPEITHLLLKEAVEKGIKNIFLQQGSANKQTIEYGINSGVNLIYNRCVFMFANPQGMHKFHSVCCKLFRTYPN